MIALLRHARFDVPGAGMVALEVRRIHDVEARCDNRAFQFMRRVEGGGVNAIGLREFGTTREAFRHWDAQVAAMVDAGFPRRDLALIGFREEG